uniref:Uncharacterized protein n=1 Tax=Hordeum vulgare subsp. vulgare TaxID=112509 RepID=A0A8I6XUW4_HORVV
MFILEAAPALKELCITVWDHWCIMITDKQIRKKYGFWEKADVKWKSYALDFRHKNLAKLTIYGFQPDDSFVRYIRCIVNHAVNLAVISLHDRKVCERCGDISESVVSRRCGDNVCPSGYPRTAEERRLTIESLGLASHAVICFQS